MARKNKKSSDIVMRLLRSLKVVDFSLLAAFWYSYHRVNRLDNCEKDLMRCDEFILFRAPSVKGSKDFFFPFLFSCLLLLLFSTCLPASELSG